ncbi:hypothetical protein CARUB_v10018685mg, partial [Capsella rubella]
RSKKVRFVYEITARHVDGEVLTPWKRRAVASLASRSLLSPPIEFCSTWQHVASSSLSPVLLQSHRI